MSRLEKIAFFSFIGLALFLSIYKIRSWDIWFHLSYGREVFNLGGIPETELFLYPFKGQHMPVIGNAAWLFGFFTYIFNYIAGINGVILFKASVCTLTMYILFRHSALLTKNHAISLVVLSLVLLSARHRFLERPEIFFYLFVAILLYSITLYIKEGKRYIYLFPILQILWVNMHPTIVIGFFIIVVYMVLGLIQMGLSRYSERRLEGAPDKNQLKILFFIFIAMAGVSFINPYKPLEAFLLPFQVKASNIMMEEVGEFLRPQWQFFVSSRGVVLLMLIASFAVSWRKLNLPHLIIASFFIYGSIQIKRMGGPTAIITAPMIAANFGYFYDRYVAEKIPTDRKAALKPLCYLLVIAMMAFFAVDNIVLRIDNDMVFGLGVKERQYPEGALQYVLENDIRGNMINTYHFGGYIEWKAYPKLQPFMDGRGFFPEGMEENYIMVRDSKKAFHALDKKYNLDFAIFEYITLEHKGTAGKLHAVQDTGFLSSNWALVYWDDTSLVYLARKPKYAYLIERDEYKFVKPSNNLNYITRYAGSESFRKGFLSEMNRKMAQDIDSVKAKYFLGLFYLTTGSYREAIDTFQTIDDKVLAKHQRFLKYQSLGEAHLRVAEYSEGIALLKTAVKISDKKQFFTYFLLANGFFKTGKYEQALSAAEKALKLSPYLVPGRKLVYDIYRKQGDEAKAEKAGIEYQKAVHKVKGEKSLMEGLRHYRKHDYHKAVEEFKKSLQLFPQNPHANSFLAFSYFYLGNYDRALEEHKKTLELDPKRSASFRGLALVYEKQNKSREALKYWKLYVKENPKGYWSRQARERIRELKSKKD